MRGVAEFVTTHNRLVILVMLVLTAGVAFGLTQEQGGTDSAVDDDALGDTEQFRAAEYIEEQYGSNTGNETNRTTANAYVLADDGSALSRESLLAALDYQLAVTADPTVSEALVDDGVQGAPNLVAAELTGEDASLETQRAAVANASDDELTAAVAAAFGGGEDTAFYLPSTYEPGTTAADAARMTFEFETDGGEHEAAHETLYETAGEHETTIFVDGPPALADLRQTLLADAAWLVVPAILLVLLLILGFAYRDLTDVVVGFTGTVVALLWSVGLMGWLGLLTQQTAIIAPVLVAALSIDFGFHVFMRYREERGPGDGIRAAMRRSTGAVSAAFLLVVATAAIGFLSNQTSPVALIRDLGVAITLGVVGALVVFTTLVPALKVSADGLWERFGFDRHGTALGKGRYLERVLAVGATAARQAPAVVIAVALVGGLFGGLLFTDLDREPFQQGNPEEAPDWQTSLPGPMAYEAHESDIVQHRAYVQDSFQSDRDGVAEDGSGYTTMLVESDSGVATPAAMEAFAAAQAAADTADPEIVLRQDGTVPVVSPLTVMTRVAAEHEGFAEQFASADTTGDGVPDRNIAALYDALFAVAPDRAGEVVERAEDGSYRSGLVLVPAQAAFDPDRADVMYGIADEISAESGLAVTAAGTATLDDAALTQITDGIVWTLLLALGGVLLALAAAYRVTHGSLLLGAVTVVPIALALGFVFGGMYLVGQPLTLLTALLVSITIGLGIDYNIHMSDRFAQELERGRDTASALHEAVTGTGGALLGSAVTSGGTFSLLALVPGPQFTSFGVIVALALGVSFVLSVLVLPSLLWLWARYGRARPADSPAGRVASGD